MAIKVGKIVVIGHPELNYKEVPEPTVYLPSTTNVEEEKEEVVEEEIETTSTHEVDAQIFNSTKKVSQYVEDALNGGEFLLFDKFINKSNNS